MGAQGGRRNRPPLQPATSKLNSGLVLGSTGEDNGGEDDERGIDTCRDSEGEQVVEFATLNRVVHCGESRTARKREEKV